MWLSFICTFIGLISPRNFCRKAFHKCLRIVCVCFKLREDSGTPIARVQLKSKTRYRDIKNRDMSDRLSKHVKISRYPDKNVRILKVRILSVWLLEHSIMHALISGHFLFRFWRIRISKCPVRAFWSFNIRMSGYLGTYCIKLGFVCQLADSFPIRLF